MNSQKPALIDDKFAAADTSRVVDIALEVRIRDIIVQMDDAAIMTDEAGRPIVVNTAAYEMLGYTLDEFSAMTIPALVHKPENYPNLWEKFDKGGYQSGPIEVRKKNGQVFTCHYNAWVHLLPGRHVVIMTDITEQVLIRRKIDESESRYRQIVETAQEGIWLFDKDHRTLFVNKKMGEILGFEVAEMIGKSIFHFVDAESAHVQNITASDPSHSGSFEMRLHSSEGQAVLTLLNVTRNFRPDGTYDGMLAMVTDITERKKAEEELKKLSLIARSTTNAIIITNPHQRIEWVNDAFCRITGYTLDEVIGKTMSFLFGEQTDRHTETVMNDSIRFHQPFTYEIVKYTKSGVPFWVEIQGRPVFDEDGKLSYYFNMETDVTERKRAFSELQKKENQIRIFARQLNHMLEEERSRIAREIHDEFGQQLMGLKMSLSYLEKLEHLPGGAAGVIRELRSGVENTFQSLRSFATELRPGILDTLGLIPSIEWLVRGFEKKSGISCVVDLDVKQQMFDWDLSIAYFRICQEALTNIVKHAHATEVKISVIEDEDFLCMRIDDNGTGMRAENVDTPFSLGLLGMQERARLIGGELTINSQPGEGTSIYLKTKTHDA